MNLLIKQGSEVKRTQDSKLVIYPVDKYPIYKVCECMTNVRYQNVLETYV